MHYTKTKMDLIADKFTFSYSNEEIAGISATSTTIDLPVQGDNIYLIGAYGKINTAFATGTAPQMKLGIEGLDDYLIPLQRTDKVGQLKSGRRGQVFCEGMANPTAKNQSIRLTIQNDSGNLSSYTAGELEIVLFYIASPTRS